MKTNSNLFLKILKNIGITLLLPACIYVFFFVLTRVIPDQIAFGSPTMLLTICQNSCLGILVALGLCVNMPTGRIDMSVGSVVILTAIMAAQITLRLNISIWLMLVISIVIAMVLSTLVGLVYIAIRIPLVVLSLGMIIIYEALTGIVFGGHGVTALEDNTRLLGYQPWCFIVAVVGLIIFHIITEYTKYAYDTKLLAGGQQMAVRIGVKENKNVVQGFIICGFFLGLAAMIYVSNYGLIESASNMSSGQILFDALLPVIVGLTLSKYSCKAIGVAVAVISMKMISYGLFCLGFNSTVQDVVSGVFILVMVIVTGKLAMRPEIKRVKDRAAMLASKANINN